MNSIVTPGDVTSIFLDVLKRRHAEHLTRFEVDRGLKIGTIERPQHFILAEPGSRTKDQPPPCVLVGAVDILDNPETATDGTLTIVWQVAIEVHVEGNTREDALLRRDAIQMTAFECVLSRVPTEGDPIDSIEPMGLPIVDGENSRGTMRLAVGGIDLNVVTRGALDRAALPPDDTDLPPGSPGGPPAGPRDPAVPWPNHLSHTDDIDMEAPDAPNAT